MTDTYRTLLDAALRAEDAAQRAAAWFGIGSPQHLRQIADADAAWERLRALDTYAIYTLTETDKE